MAVDLDEVTSLYNIGAIEHVKKALLFERDKEFVVDKVKKYIRCFLIWGSDSKVVNLSFEDDSFASNYSPVKTGSMDSGS